MTPFPQIVLKIVYFSDEIVITAFKILDFLKYFFLLAIISSF